MLTKARRESGHYWDNVSQEWGPTVGDDLWREHCDGLHETLLNGWVTPGAGRLLKTDLFDESLAKGVLPQLSQVGNHLFGIDLSYRTVLRATAHHELRNSCSCDVRRLPFAADSFDLVISNSTLDHFESRAEIDQSLREIERVLAPGGELVLTLDNLSNPVIKLRHKLPFEWLERLSIVPYFVGETLNVDEAKAMLRSAGFEILDVSTLMHFPRVISIFVSRYVGKSRFRGVMLRMLDAFERLGRWRTRFVTAHYFAIRARKERTDLKSTGHGQHAESLAPR
ncbi:MAG: methyltransferase domain-containing protein [Myxococcota bacterium]|nr:methyltransferase domain-containing protein [Myxococcota bacterium]